MQQEKFISPQPLQPCMCPSLPALGHFRGGWDVCVCVCVWFLTTPHPPRTGPKFGCTAFETQGCVSSLILPAVMVPAFMLLNCNFFYALAG